MSRGALGERFEQGWPRGVGVLRGGGGEPKLAGLSGWSEPGPRFPEEERQLPRAPVAWGLRGLAGTRG